jgi:hypothetical protein
MNNLEHKENLANLSNLTREENNTLCIWFRHVILVTSTLFGILISLHSNTPDSLYARLCFSLANILLALAIAGLLSVLYNLSAGTARNLRAAYQREVENARRECRETRPVGVHISKGVFFVEKASYICIAAALLLLAFYSLLTYLC